MLQRCTNRTNCCWLLVILLTDALVVMALEHPESSTAGCSVCCPKGQNRYGTCTECSNASGKPCHCTLTSGFSCVPGDQINPPEPEPSTCNCCYDNPTGTCKVCNTPLDSPCACKPIGFSRQCEPDLGIIEPEIIPEPSRCNCCYDNRRGRCKVCNTPADYPCSCKLIGFSTRCEPDLEQIKPEPSRCKCCYENRTKRCKVCNTPADYPCSCRLNFLTPSDPSTLCVPEL